MDRNSSTPLANRTLLWLVCSSPSMKVRTSIHSLPQSRKCSVCFISNEYTVGSFIGAIACSFVGESLGRRKSVATGSVFMILGATIQATSYSRAQLIVGRIVAGIGMGFLNSTTPVMQSEYAPQAHRGKCKYFFLV